MANNFFAQTQDKFGIKNSELARATGFSAAYVSEIRNGKASPTYEGLTRWLDGAEQVAPGSRRYFCRLMAGSPIDLVIDEMSSADLAQLLTMIATRLEHQTLSKNLIPA
jgi:transcriptional regulator with XRE-family HTH domain